MCKSLSAGETFGLVVSDHIATFGGFLVKEENVEKGLLDSFEPSVNSETVEMSSSMSGKLTLRFSHSLPKLQDQCNAVKKLQTLALPSSSEVPTMGPGAGLLDAYFPSVRDMKSSKEGHPLAMVTSAGINNSVIAPDQQYKDCSGAGSSAGINNSVSTGINNLVSAGINNLVSTGINNLVSTSINNLVIAPNQRYKDCPPSASINNSIITPNQRYKDHPVCSSAGINNSVTVAAGQTQSQHFFLISTGIDPRSLTFQSSDEFYMFMDMRAKFKWLSYQMTSKRWVLATEEYNRCLMKKNGQSVVPKNPQALLCVLGDIEPKLMSKITKNDYIFESHTETEESGKKACKAQTCSHCQTIMYPGPENSPLNHKKGYCADGVKQSSKTASEELPPWPQPRGIFSEGRTFHPHVFLSTVQRVYEHVFMQGPGETDLLETEVFLKLLISCTNVHKSDNMVLFWLFKGFITDPTTPHDWIVSHDGEEWLRINYLQQ
ncbi:hypothetical protein BD769DRAFT_1388490 [Suillus cothurnatus]|nr:hypothetical protein BD769DRAFT_1388490 [Suillus cothurnatus]